MKSFKLIAAACGCTIALSACVVDWSKTPTESVWLVPGHETPRARTPSQVSESAPTRSGTGGAATR